MTEHNRKISGRSPSRRIMIDEDGHYCLLSAIYDLALAPTNWPIVLGLLAEALNSPHASSVITTPERDAPRPLGAVGITAEDHRAFLRAWHKSNVFGTRRPAREAGTIVLGRTILAKPTLLRTAMYRQYLEPRGIHELVRLDILADAYRSQSIALARPWASGPFTSDELAFARALMPHLQRVANLHAHIEGPPRLRRARSTRWTGLKPPAPARCERQGGSRERGGRASFARGRRAECRLSWAACRNTRAFGPAPGGSRPCGWL